MKTAAVIGCGDVSVVHFEAIEALADRRARGGLRRGPGCRLARLEPLRRTELRQPYRAPRRDAARRRPHHHPARPARPARDRRAGRRRPRRRREAGGAHLQRGGPPGGAAEQPGAPKIAVCFQNRYNATSQAAAALLASGRARARSGRVGHGLLAPPTGVLPVPALARPVRPQRRRRADQPGHPQCRPAAVAAGRGPRGARSGQPAGPRRRGRRGHRADRDGPRRRRPVGLLRHQCQRHRLTGHPGDRHRSAPSCSSVATSRCGTPTVASRSSRNGRPPRAVGPTGVSPTSS